MVFIKHYLQPVYVLCVLCMAGQLFLFVFFYIRHVVCLNWGRVPSASFFAICSHHLYESRLCTPLMNITQLPCKRTIFTYHSPFPTWPESLTHNAPKSARVVFGTSAYVGYYLYWNRACSCLLWKDSRYLICAYFENRVRLLSRFHGVRDVWILPTSCIQFLLVSNYLQCEIPAHILRGLVLRYITQVTKEEYCLCGTRVLEKI